MESIRTPNPRAFSDLVRSKRMEYGWSQEELAIRAGTSRTHINKIERGRISLPRAELMSRIMAALELTEEETKAFWSDLSGREDPYGWQVPELFSRIPLPSELAEAGLMTKVYMLFLSLNQRQLQRLEEIVDQWEAYRAGDMKKVERLARRESNHALPTSDDQNPQAGSQPRCLANG